MNIKKGYSYKIINEWIGVTETMNWNREPGKCFIVCITENWSLSASLSLWHTFLSVMDLYRNSFCLKGNPLLKNIIILILEKFITEYTAFILLFSQNTGQYKHRKIDL